MDFYDKEADLQYVPNQGDQAEMDRLNQEYENQLVEQEKAEEEQAKPEMPEERTPAEGKERSYSENKTIKGAQQAADAVMDTPLLGSVAGVGAGVVDTAMDVVGLVPGLSSADDWYDEHFGRKRTKNGVAQFIRDASAIILPTLAGGWGLVGKAATATKAINMGKRVRAVGTIAADLGIGTAVDAVSDQTREGGNSGDLVEAVAGAVGLDIDVPWATGDDTNPDWIYQKNMMDGIGLGAVTGLLDGVLRLARGGPAGQSIKPTNEAAENVVQGMKAADEAAVAKAGGDEALGIAEKGIKSSQDEQLREARKVMEADPEGEGGYNAFVNEPAEPQARATMNNEANPLLWKAANARIMDGLGTQKGRQPPAVTQHFKEDYMKAGSGTKAKMMDGLGDAIEEPKFEVTVGSNTLTTKEVEDAVDALVSSVNTVDQKEFAKTITTLKKQSDEIMGNKVNFLSRDNFNVAAIAFKKAFEVLDPKKLKAAGVFKQQIAGEVADVSRGIEKFGQTIDTTRQQTMIWDNLTMLMNEIRRSQFIDGWRLQADKLAQNKSKEGIQAYAEWMDSAGKNFEVTLQGKAESTLEFMNTLRDISEAKPEFFKPLYREFIKSNGNVDNLGKLMEFAENNVAVIKKAFYDGAPEVPSQLMKQATGVRYNNILLGRAPIKASAGAAMGLLGKPLTILAGSLVKGDTSTLKRSLMVYGGIQENFMRAFKNARLEFQAANSGGTGATVRTDIIHNQLENVETMEEMAEVWSKSNKIGDKGKAAMWNMTKVLSWYNNLPITKLGISAMTAVDGFVRSMSASASARARAYDELYDAGKGAVDLDQFYAKQNELYDLAFDKNGKLTDEAARYASQEMNLQLDNKAIAGLEDAMKHYPMLRTIFMFPKTGINALQLAGTFAPTGAFGQSIGKARKVFKAITPQEIEEVLVEHGMKGQGIEAFNALKSEYIGRQIMGGSVVMGATLMAANGNLTGSGPADDAEKRRMISMGWQPFSVKMENGEWRSYQGLEPFDTFLGLAADMTYNLNRVDQAASEDWMRSLAASISHNITQKSFLSGLEPLSGLISGDVGTFHKFLANNTDSLIPATGIRSILSKAWVPQLKEVENNFFSYLANRNRFLPPINAALKDKLDVYTGDPIKYFDPMVANFNTLMPFFSTNGGQEEWRQRMLATGWDNLQNPRTRPDGQPLTPEDKSWVNNWIASNYKLGERVEALMMQPDDYWNKQIKEYAKARGQRTQQEFPIKETIVHKKLDELHNAAYNAAWDAYMRENGEIASGMGLQELTKQQLRSNQFKQAASTATQIQNLLDYPVK